MNILVPFGRAELGGSQLTLIKTVELLRHEGFSFCCWLFEDGPLKDELERRDVPVTMQPRSLLRNPFRFGRLCRQLGDLAPDLIYLHASRVIALAARSTGIPCLERINMTRRPEAGGWARIPLIDRIMTGWNTHVLAVSEAIRDQLTARGLSTGDITIVRNGVDPDRFSDRGNRTGVRRDLGLEDDQELILNIGRHVPQKGQLDFIEAAGLHAREHPGARFVIIGEGPLRADLEQRARTLGLEQALTFLPFQERIEDYFAAADLYVHSARWEPLANVLLEAMAAGLPIVATDVDGSREALASYGPHVLAPPEDPTALATALATAPRERGQLPDEFTMTAFGSRIGSLFRKVAACR